MRSALGAAFRSQSMFDDCGATVCCSKHTSCSENCWMLLNMQHVLLGLLRIRSCTQPPPRSLPLWFSASIKKHSVRVVQNLPVNQHPVTECSLKLLIKGSLGTIFRQGFSSDCIVTRLCHPSTSCSETEPPVRNQKSHIQRMVVKDLSE